MLDYFGAQFDMVLVRSLHNVISLDVFSQYILTIWCTSLKLLLFFSDLQRFRIIHLGSDIYILFPHISPSTIWLNSFREFQHKAMFWSHRPLFLVEMIEQV